MSRSRSLPRRHRRNLRIKLRLEFLEDRRLLDAKSQILYYPEAVLRPDYGTTGNPQGITLDQPPGANPDTPTNVLVNDPNEDGHSANDTQSETALTLGANNTIISAYNDSFYASANQYTGYSVSSDGGQTFVDKGRLPVTSAGDLGDPSLGTDKVTGRVYLATLTFGVPLDVWRSDDNGNTFMPPVNAAPGRSGLDKEILAVDNASGPGQGNVYVIFRDFGSGNGIYLTRSTDQGATFGPNGGTLIASGSAFNVQGAWVTVGPDHTVYAFWYAANNAIMMRKSTDFGVSFGAPVTVAPLSASLGVNGDLGLGGFRSNAFPQAVVNPATGDIYVTFDNRGAGGQRADVFFTQSTDGGATWSTPVSVTDDTTTRDKWQPAIAVTPDGAHVGIFWYDRRNDPANNLIDRYGVVGTVAGHVVTFAPNFQITDQAFPPEFGHDPAINSIYMGDYDTAVASPGFFYLTWGDNRSLSLGHAGHNADVRFAAIPLATAGGAVIGSSPSGTVTSAVDHIRFTFDESMRPHSFDKISTAIPGFTDPNGNPIPVLSVTPVPGTNNTQFDVAFPQQTQAGTYTMVIGPKIRDRLGRWMDQDGDGMGHQADDGYTATFTIEGARITSFVRSGAATTPPSNVRVTFDEPVDPNTFDPTQVTSFTDPNGNPITVNSVTPVSGSNNTQFDIGFDPQSVVGTYSMTIGPNILDFNGNPMPVAFTGTFIYTDEAIVNGSFEMQFTGWSASSGWIITGPGHGDANAAGSGAVGSTTPLSQVITTVVGQQYTFSFWYSRVDGTPAEIHAFFGGLDVYDEVNTPSHDYQFHTFTVTATSTSTTILFMGRNDPSYDLLDDVSVRPVHTLAAAHGGSASAVSLASSIFSVHTNALANSAVLTQATAQATGADTQSSIAEAQRWDAIDQALMPASAMQPALGVAGLTAHNLLSPAWADPWATLTGDDGLLL
jgi:hypothetical protein